jgi:tetratricopeptide (TPR) repeat protein
LFAAGVLSPEADFAIRYWDVAVMNWKRERDAGAAPLLAEGVLFDCLSRLTGVRTRVLRLEVPVPFFQDLAAKRPERALKAFRAALAVDPTLSEARFRAARIQSRTDRTAERELERIADEEPQLALRYLAAMSRGEAAATRNDDPDAAKWYRRALESASGSVAARVGLATVSADAEELLATSDRDDLFYLYPCVVLTPSVRSALEARIRSAEVAK